MENASFITQLNALSLIKISGIRAKELLQGQLTCHLDEITETHSSLAAHCNPHGRIISFFRIFYFDACYYLLLPKSLLPLALQALKKYAIFFKVMLEELNNALFCFGLYHPTPTENFIAYPEKINEVIFQNNFYITKIDSNRYLFIGNENLIPLLPSNLAIYPDSEWFYLDIINKIPNIYPETIEKFLPHDLNLPKLNAVSFNKGCYTGQEIIARMQHRGKLKTQLLNAEAIPAMTLTRGQTIYNHAKKPVGEIVDFCKKNDQYQLLFTATEKENLFLDIEINISLQNII